MLRVCFDDADLGKFMHRSFFRHRRLALACVFGLSAMSQQASAGNPLESAWDCAKASAGGAANIGADLAKKAETIASMSGELGVCLGKSGADQTGFAITMGAITATIYSSVVAGDEIALQHPVDVESHDRFGDVHLVCAIGDVAGRERDALV